MTNLTWNEYYSQAEQNSRNAHEASLILRGRSFVSKDQLLWYIDYLCKSSNTVAPLVEQCRYLEEAFSKALKIAKEEESRANKLSEEVAELKKKLEEKDKVIENFTSMALGSVEYKNNRNKE